MALGGRSIAEWKRVMTMEEFTFWKALYRRFPFGPVAENSRYSRGLAYLMNAILRLGRKNLIKPEDVSQSLDP